MILSRQKGFNLLELMLALVVMVSVLLLAGHYYRTARESTRVSQAAHQVNQILDAGFRYLEAKPGRASQDMLAVLVDMDLLPESFKHNPQLNPWSAPISMAYHQSEVGAGVFEIVIQKVSAKACYQLMNLMNKSSGIAEKQDPKNPAFSCVESGGAEKDFKGQIELRGAS